MDRSLLPPGRAARKFQDYVTSRFPCSSRVGSSDRRNGESTMVLVPRDEVIDRFLAENPELECDRAEFASVFPVSFPEVFPLDSAKWEASNALACAH
jgi:hypothetical protein